MRSVDPAGWLRNYIENRDNRDIDLAAIKTTLLEGTAHGNITTEVDNTGRTSYGYDAVPNYVGKDKAVFMAEFEGKRYKIVIDLRVFIMVDENHPVCPPPQLIKVNGKPVSGSASYDLNTFPVTFADLTGSALGQTTGTTITLDTNAAGNGWFIDTTPGLNEEYLPTSNPNEWVVKAGSAVGWARLCAHAVTPSATAWAHKTCPPYNGTGNFTYRISDGTTGTNLAGVEDTALAMDQLAQAAYAARFAMNPTQQMMK